MEVRFLVDGAKGERIVRVVVDTGPGGRGDFRIQVNLSKPRQINVYTADSFDNDSYALTLDVGVLFFVMRLNL